MGLVARRTIRDDDVEDIYALYQTYASWEDRDLAAVRTALSESDVNVGIYDTDERRFVAAARVLTDFTYYASIVDVIVDESHREQGIGQRLMAETVSTQSLRGIDQITLVAREGLVDFYRECGFTVHDMEIEIDGRTEDFYRMELTDRP